MHDNSDASPQDSKTPSSLFSDLTDRPSGRIHPLTEESLNDLWSRIQTQDGIPSVRLLTRSQLELMKWLSRERT